MERTSPKVIWGYQVAVKLKPLSGEEGRKSHPSQKSQKGHSPPPTMSVETPHPILDPHSGKNLLWRWRTSGHASIKSLQDVSFTSVDCMLSRSSEKKWNLYNFLSKSKLSPHTVGSYPAREQEAPLTASCLERDLLCSYSQGWSNWLPQNQQTQTRPAHEHQRTVLCFIYLSLNFNLKALYFRARNACL